MMNIAKMATRIYWLVIVMNVGVGDDVSFSELVVFIGNEDTMLSEAEKKEFVKMQKCTTLRHAPF